MVTIEIAVLNDTLDEEDESFFVTISSPKAAELGTPFTAECIIIDDDDAPDIIISNAMVDEVDAGTTTNLIFDVSLSGESGKTIEVNYSTSDETATKGLDYTATQGTLTFNPGQKGPKQIEVPVIGDDLLEANETLTLNLMATNAKNTTYSAIGTIKNNDKPIVSINDVSVTEDTSLIAVFKVSLSKPSSQNVLLKFITKDGSAVKGSDYIEQTGAIPFAAGQSGEKVIVIDIKDDEIYEGTESFYVELFYISDPAIEVVKKTGTGTIYDNESIPKIWVETTPVNEGNSSISVATFTVKVLPASATDIFVDYGTLDGTAESGKDYTAAAGTLKIPAGQKSGIINVNVKGDTIYEDNEIFSLSLSNPTGAQIDSSRGTAECTINDDDLPPSATFDQSTVKVNEGDSAATLMVFNVTLSEVCEKTVFVDYTSEDGTATTEDNDYTPVSGMLVFAPGETSKSITVNVNGDKDGEPDENFFVVLKSNTGDIKAEGIIEDDDSPFIKMYKETDDSEIANGNTVYFENTKTGNERELEFTISNMGNANLTEGGTNKLVSITGSDFILKNEPVSPIAGKASITFTVVFKPSSSGTKTAEITITGKDAVNSPFKFKVSGTGTSDNSIGGGTGGGTVSGTTPEPQKGSIPIPTPVDDTFIFTPSIIKEMLVGQQSINIDNGLQITADLNTIPRNDNDAIIIKASEIKNVSTLGDFYQAYPTQQALYKGYEVSFIIESNNRSTPVTELLGEITLKFQLTPEELKGVDPNSIVVYKEDDNGVITKLHGTFDPATSTFKVTTNHLCNFYLMAQKASTEPWTNPFHDVKKSDWFYSAVEFANRNGIFAGTGSNTFSPNLSMTRAMLWTVLGRVNGQKLSGDDAFDNARTWAMNAGITDGTNPNGNITREQMVTILWRYAGSPKTDGDLSKFSDAKKVSDYAYDAMIWAVKNGIINGSNGALMPRDYTNRAQVAAVLQRFLK